MVNGIQCSKLIGKLLVNSSKLKSMVGKKIFPLIVDPNKTTYPYIVFSRDSLESNYTKDNCIYDKVVMEIAVFSTKYEESVDIANEVRKCLELVKYKDDDLMIGECKLISVSESFSENAFVQILNFLIIVE